MAVVNIPAALRPLAGGAARAEAGGETLWEVIEALEVQFPGLRARLVEGDRVRPGMAVFVNGTQAAPQLSTRVPAEAEIYFAPAIAGGIDDTCHEFELRTSDREGFKLQNSKKSKAGFHRQQRVIIGRIGF